MHNLSDLLRPEVQAFISENIQADVYDLQLRRKSFVGVGITPIVEQIQSRKRAKTKIPSWFARTDLIFPPPVSVEQCSSEKTAVFKSRLFKGYRMADLTGGAGVDSFYFSQQFELVDFVERDAHLCQVARHNFKVLGAKNIRVYNSSAEGFLDQNRHLYDLIYLDPARRVQQNRVVGIESCSPNVISLQTSLHKVTRRVLLKLSPLLDIRLAFEQLMHVSTLYIVGTGNEVKELLIEVDMDASGTPSLECIDVDDVKSRFQFTLDEESKAQVEYADPRGFVYVPSNVLLKSGAFKLVGSRFGLAKLHKNTHLYTSDDLKTDFPGRVFRIKNSYPSLHSFLNHVNPQEVAIISKNYILNAQQLKKKIESRGFRTGNKAFLIVGRTLTQKSVFLFCEKVK